MESIKPVHSYTEADRQVPLTKEATYQLLLEQLQSLLAGKSAWITTLANASALVFNELDEINWAGFYLYEDGELILGPFQGRPACTTIALGKGVCGTAAQERRTVRVDDVHQFAGHIACDSASESEIVIPLIKENSLFGVFDIDSPSLSRFDAIDQRYLEAYAEIVLAALSDEQSAHAEALVSPHS